MSALKNEASESYERYIDRDDTFLAACVLESARLRPILREHISTYPPTWNGLSLMYIWQHFPILNRRPRIYTWMAISSPAMYVSACEYSRLFVDHHSRPMLLWTLRRSTSRTLSGSTGLNTLLDGSSLSTSQTYVIPDEHSHSHSHSDIPKLTRRRSAIICGDLALGRDNASASISVSGCSRLLSRRSFASTSSSSQQTVLRRRMSCRRIVGWDCLRHGFSANRYEGARSMIRIVFIVIVTTWE